jgi:phosphatidylglycerophosphatase A
MNTGEKIITLFSTGIYTGYFPIAPATFSTMTLGVAVYLLMSSLNPLLYAVITLALTPLAVWLSDKSEQIFQKKDSGHIVIDELVGFLITMFMIPFTWTSLIMGFFFFRFFDIVKPPPAHFFNKRSRNGLDVVMDDVVAGIYSNLALQIFNYFYSQWIHQAI